MLNNIVKNFTFLNTYKIALSVSVMLLLISLGGLFVKGLDLSVDFKGGSLLEFRLERDVDLSIIRDAFFESQLETFSLRESGYRSIVVEIPANDNFSDVNSLKNFVQSVLADTFGNVKYMRTEFVGPRIGKELIIDGIIAFCLAIFAIVIYIWSRFGWRFGIGATFALLHDIILVLGVFSWFAIQFDMTSIAVLLTIIGYSVNDSVVIYDRIREYMQEKFTEESFPRLLSRSIKTTLGRTLVTAGTTVSAIVALVLLGGDALRGFSITMLVGVVIGTYSSVYVAVPLLLYMGVGKVVKDLK